MWFRNQVQKLVLTRLCVLPSTCVIFFYFQSVNSHLIFFFSIIPSPLVSLYLVCNNLVNGQCGENSRFLRKIFLKIKNMALTNLWSIGSCNLESPQTKRTGVSLLAFSFNLVVIIVQTQRNQWASPSRFLSLQVKFHNCNYNYHNNKKQPSRN